MRSFLAALSLCLIVCSVSISEARPMLPASVASMDCDDSARCVDRAPVSRGAANVRDARVRGWPSVRIERAMPVHILGGRPAGCPSAWCGCWLGLRKNMTARSLWVARNWARVGTAASGPAPGIIAVWRHHVGEVTAVPGAGRIVLLSGNDGGAVRERERSTRGVIAWRQLERRS